MIGENLYHTSGVNLYTCEGVRTFTPYNYTNITIRNITIQITALRAVKEIIIKRNKEIFYRIV